jgi:hypothetical protein
MAHRVRESPVMPPEEEQRILLTQATPGMVLSRPVQLPNKMVLCPRGAELADGLITRLMGMGIKRVWVRGKPLPAFGQEGYSQRIARLRASFARVRHIPLMGALEQAIEKQIVRRS